MAPDPDPTIFVIDFQYANKKNKFVCEVFLLITFKSYIYIYLFSKIKSQKLVTKAFSYYFLFEKGSGSEAGSRFIPLTNGPGSGLRRPKKHMDSKDPVPDLDP